MAALTAMPAGSLVNRLVAKAGLWRDVRLRFDSFSADMALIDIELYTDLLMTMLSTCGRSRVQRHQTDTCGLRQCL